MYSVHDFIQCFENEYPIITNTGEVNNEGYTEFDENSKLIKIYYDGNKPRKYHRLLFFLLQLIFFLRSCGNLIEAKRF